VEIDPEYKPGTTHLTVDPHDFHEVVMGHTVYVPPDLAAQQEAYYARKAGKRQSVVAAPAGGAGSAAPAAAAVAVPTGA
jgi:hypothetical protein